MARGSHLLTQITKIPIRLRPSDPKMTLIRPALHVNTSYMAIHYAVAIDTLKAVSSSYSYNITVLDVTKSP